MRRVVPDRLVTRGAAEGRRSECASATETTAPVASVVLKWCFVPAAHLLPWGV